MKTNVIIAASIALLLTAWMVVGSLFAQNGDTAPEAEPPPEEKLPSVRVRESIAEEFAANITLRGKTEASRASLLKAETGGRVLEIVAQRGERAKKGDIIIRIDPQSLPEQLEAAAALVAQRELEYQAAQKLQSSGYQSETRLAETSSQLAQARNQLVATRIALENTEIKAPFDGVFNERLVEVGEFVASGDPVANFLDLDPMIITAQATEAEIEELERGATAKAKIGGRSVEGVIRYISQSANEAVRTYTIELEFDNSDHTFQAGLTADIIAQAETQLAHKVTPAILFLGANTDGDLGIKTVEDDSTVNFYKTTIIGSDNDGVWVSGLPERARIITVGQGYVVPGATVEAIDESTIQ